MRKLNIVIVDLDDGYLNGITNFFNYNYGQEFQVISISDINYFNEYLTQNKKIDILLIDESLYSVSLKDKMINTIIVLIDVENKKDLYDNSICKFKAGDDIYHEMKGIFLKINPHYKLHDDNITTKIFSVYSPLGGIGKTSVAASLAMNLSSLGNEVLYLNFEDVPSTSLFFDIEDNDSLSDIVYLAQERQEHFESFVSNAFLKDESGVFYLPQINSMLDLVELNMEDINYLLQELKKLNKFSYIVIDTASKYHSSYNSIFSNSDKIIFILGQDKRSKLRADNYLSQQEYLDNYMFVVNKYNENLELEVPNTIGLENKDIAYKISYDSLINENFNGKTLLFGNNVFSISMNQFVKLLIEDKESDM